MKNRISRLVTKLIVASCTCFSLSAFAADDDSGFLSMKKPNMFTSEYKPHFGLLAGVTSPEGSSDDESTLGLDIGYSPTRQNATLGGEYSFSQIGSGRAEEDQHTVLLKAGYNFGGDTMLIRHSWIGLGAGAIFTDDDTLAVASPMLGIDIPVTSQDKEYITLGANARYNFIENLEGVDDTMTINGAVKYWY